MAWRIADHIVRGDIDNRLPGIIKGTLYVEGLKEPLLLELEGNCDPDLAGRHLTFRNLMPQPGTNLEGLCRIQCGTPGTMSANRMVRLPMITPEQLENCLKERKPFPTRWSESLYLEWYGPDGRVLVEGAGFICQLTAARWKLSEEAHRWSVRLSERKFDNLPTNDVDGVTAGERIESQDPSAGTADRDASYEAADLRPHPLVRRLSDFLLRAVDEYHRNKFYSEEVIVNQPLEIMIEAISTANTRLAMTMAKAARVWLDAEPVGIIRDLKRARWLLAEATENAGLADHMGSANPDWLAAIRLELVELRGAIRTLSHDFEERVCPSSTTKEANPHTS
jgi:hypothetical protein